MSTVALVALARPTFDLACAQANFDSARALLQDLGAIVVGPAELVMTVEDVAAVTLPEADLQIQLSARLQPCQNTSRLATLRPEQFAGTKQLLQDLLEERFQLLVRHTMQTIVRQVQNLEMPHSVETSHMLFSIQYQHRFQR